jgi:hypothetical protein
LGDLFGWRINRGLSPLFDTDCCLPAGQNRRHSPTKIFGAQHLQGRLHPLPLHLACFRDYASTCPLPSTPQGSILGWRLTITQAGLPPARSRGLARPHCPQFLLRTALRAGQSHRSKGARSKIQDLTPACVPGLLETPSSQCADMISVLASFLFPSVPRTTTLALSWF